MKLHFDIITCLPGLLKGAFDHSILKRAIKNKMVSIDIVDLRDFGLGKHRQIDDYQFGGGAGMVLMPEPLGRAIESRTGEHEFDDIIYLTPDGETLDQHKVNYFSSKKRIMLICGHYKGIDHRIREKYVTREISIGDFVLSGGELAATVFVDAVARVIPGVINDGSSALSDSHQDGLLAPPVYTRPADYDGMKVPEVLLSGHEARIKAWREELALLRTKQLRPDLFEKHHED